MLNRPLADIRQAVPHAAIAGTDLRRVPAPYPADHPGTDLLRHKTMFQLRWPPRHRPELGRHLATPDRIAPLAARAGDDPPLPTDIAVVAEWLGLPFQSLTGARSFEITHAYVAAFTDQRLWHRHQPLLDDPSPHFPQVDFVAMAGG